LIAVARGREVGVDLERHKAVREGDGIVQSFFAEQTRQDYFQIAEPDRPAAFFRGWTRGEAVMKAVGDGFSLRVDVSVAPSDPPRVREVIGRPGEAERWRLVDLAVGPDFTAALAIEGEPAQLTLMNGRWSEAPGGGERSVLFNVENSPREFRVADVML
jgi:4'-phosphopantetheinyl transferase